MFFTFTPSYISVGWGVVLPSISLLISYAAQLRLNAPQSCVGLNGTLETIYSYKQL